MILQLDRPSQHVHLRSERFQTLTLPAATPPARYGMASTATAAPAPLSPSRAPLPTAIDSLDTIIVPKKLYHPRTRPPAQSHPGHRTRSLRWYAAAAISILLANIVNDVGLALLLDLHVSRCQLCD